MTSVGLAVALAAPAAANSAGAAQVSAGISFVTAPPSSAVVGDHYDVRVRGGDATAPVELHTQDDSVCPFVGSVVTFTAAGTCLVEAHQGADATHADADADAAQLVDIATAPAAGVAAPVTVAPATVAPATVHKVAPMVAVVGARAGAAYPGAGPRARCQARQPLGRRALLAHLDAARARHDGPGSGIRSRRQRVAGSGALPGVHPLTRQETRRRRDGDVAPLN